MTDLLILDTVPHRRLLHKMQHYGVTGRTNRWISSWLCQRRQRVVLDGSASSDSPVLYGVPQDTVLGPLMFLLYVNDIGVKVSPQTTTKLFAGDCLLYKTIDSVVDANQLQQDLDSMVDWSNTRLMMFNAAKCHLLKITRQQKGHPTSYTIKGVQLQQVDHHPYLGVELTSDLTWKTHISNITTKANIQTCELASVTSVVVCCVSLNIWERWNGVELLLVNVAPFRYKSA